MYFLSWESLSSCWQKVGKWSCPYWEWEIFKLQNTTLGMFQQLHRNTKLRVLPRALWGCNYFSSAHERNAGWGQKPNTRQKSCNRETKLFFLWSSTSLPQNEQEFMSGIVLGFSSWNSTDRAYRVIILEVSKRTLICAKKSRFFSKFHQFLVEVLDSAHHSDVRRQSWTCCYQWYHTAAALWGGCHALKCQNTKPCAVYGSTISTPACRARHRLAPHLQLSFLLVQNASMLEQKYDVPCFCFSTLLRKLLRGGQ